MADQFKKILILRFSSIGDIVVTTPIVRAIKLQLGAEVHFLVKKKFRSVIDQNKYIDKVFSFDKDWKEIGKDLKSENYDLIIDLHKNLRSQRLRFYLGLHSISFDKMNVEKFLLTNLRIDRMPEKHLVDRYFEGMKSIGLENDGNGLDFFIDQKEEDSISSLDLPQNYVVIVLGAAHFTKRIRAELIIDTILKIKNPIILIGGKDVEDIGQEIVESSSKNITNLVGKLSIHASAAVIDKSEVVITGDTGMMHISAALKKKIVMVWGSTHRKIGMYPYYPKGKNLSIDISMNLNCQPCTKIGNSRCPKSHFNCMRQISSNDIISATNELLSRN